jgi:hypothetical protein
VRFHRAASYFGRTKALWRVLWYATKVDRSGSRSRTAELFHSRFPLMAGLTRAPQAIMIDSRGRFSKLRGSTDKKECNGPGSEINQKQFRACWYVNTTQKSPQERTAKASRAALLPLVWILQLPMCWVAMGPSATAKAQAGYAGGSPLPVMGYSLWAVREFWSTEREVWQLIDCIKTNHLDELGWKYILPDDLEIRPGGGIYYSNGIPYSANYPSGFANLFERCHTNGLKLGWFMDVTLGVDYYAPAMDFLRSNDCDYVHVDFGYSSPHTAYAQLASLLRSGRTVPPVILGAVDFTFPEDLTNDIFQIADVWDLLPEYADPVASITSLYNNFKAVVQCHDHVKPGSVPFAMPAMMQYGAAWYRTVFGLSCVTSSAIVVDCFDNLQDPFRLFVGNFPACCTNREMIAIDQDPLVAGAHELRDTNGIWAICKPLKGDDVALCVLNYNTSGPNVTISVPFAACGLAPGPVLVRDAFQQSSLGIMTGQFSTSPIPTGEVVVYRLTPQPKPQTRLDVAFRNGLLNLTFIVNSNYTTSVQTSTNLMNWTELGRLSSNSNGLTTYTTPSVPGRTACFYRVVSATSQ